MRRYREESWELELYENAFTSSTRKGNVPKSMIEVGIECNTWLDYFEKAELLLQENVAASNAATSVIARIETEVEHLYEPHGALHTLFEKWQGELISQDTLLKGCHAGINTLRERARQVGGAMVVPGCYCAPLVPLHHLHHLAPLIGTACTRWPVR